MRAGLFVYQKGHKTDLHVVKVKVQNTKDKKRFVILVLFGDTVNSTVCTVKYP